MAVTDVVRVRCPHCKNVIEVDDSHRPFRCPRCGAVLQISVYPPGVSVLFGPGDLTKSGRE